MYFNVKPSGDLGKCLDEAHALRSAYVARLLRDAAAALAAGTRKAEQYLAHGLKPKRHCSQA